MHCPGCGAQNQEGARICRECGQKLEFGIKVKKQDEQPVAPAPDFDTFYNKRRGKGLSIASLVFGILAVLPFGWFAGVPAIVLGALALTKKRPGRGMALTGLVMGAAAPILSTLVFFAVLPGIVHGQERARQSSVRNAMHVVQTALEAYAADHEGHYPSEAEWAADGRMRAYFPGGDPTADGEPAVGRLPANPYTGREYEPGIDLFYYSGHLEAGQNGILESGDDLCPYAGFEAPQARPGTIVILGSTDETQKPTHVLEYGICGFGRDTSDPMSEPDKANPGDRVYFVLSDF